MASLPGVRTSFPAEEDAEGGTPPRLNFTFALGVRAPDFMTSLLVELPRYASGDSRRDAPAGAEGDGAAAAVDGPVFWKERREGLDM